MKSLMFLMINNFLFDIILNLFETNDYVNNVMYVTNSNSNVTLRNVSN